MSNRTLNDELLKSCGEGNLQRVKELLDQGADINFKEFTPKLYKIAPIARASCAGHNDVVELLLERGANIDETDNAGDTPLMIAAKYGRLSTALLLMNRGANIHHKNHKGWTPIVTASYWGYKELVEALIARGANMNARDNEGKTPLMVVCARIYNYSQDVGSYLLENGADFHVKDNKGDTAIILASKNEKQQLIKALTEKGANLQERNLAGESAMSFFGCNPINKTLYDSAEQGNTKEMNEAIEQGAGVNTRSISGWTHLIIASSKGHIEAVKLLIEKGADVNLESEKGDTALTVAATEGYDNIIQVLTNAGAINSVIEKKLIYQDEKSNKFWDIEIVGRSFTVTFGKIGSRGQSQTKDFESNEECKQEANKLIAKKLRKGYREKEEEDIETKTGAQGLEGIPIQVLKEQAASGTSKLGGWPDLPASIKWPKGEKGSLAFLCQINLAEFFSDFASKGMLYFFTVPSSDDLGHDHAVIFYDGDEKFELRKASLEWMEGLVDVELPLPEFKLTLGSKQSEGDSHLFGQGDYIQEDIEEDDENIRRGEKLILQIDASQFGDTFQYVCGEDGILCFLMPKKDFAKKNFKNARAIIQST